MSDSNVLVLGSQQGGVFRRPAPLEHHKRRRGLTAIAVLTMAVISLAIHYLTPMEWDIAATRTLQSLSLPGLHEFLRIISGFGNAPKMVAVTVMALLACNKRREAVFLTLSGLGGWFLAVRLKQVFASSRPTSDVVAVFNEWPDGSFPSGHVVFYVCFFGFLFFIARKALRAGSVFRSLVLGLLALPICLVGVARVYLGEHWLSDVPGSYLLGGLWLALSLKLYTRWTSARERPRQLAMRVST